MVDIYVKRRYKINYLSSTGIRCKAVYCHEIYIVETKRFLTMADLLINRSTVLLAFHIMAPVRENPSTPSEKAP